MGMSTHVVGFRPADPTWRKMKAAWDACVEANIEIPDELYRFFDGESPGDKPGMEVKIEQAVSKYQGEGCNGYEVNLQKLPTDVSVVRFYNSY